MEAMDSSLKALLDSKAPLEWEPTLWRVAADVAMGMAYLHDQKPKPVLHHDLKSDNVLLFYSASAGAEAALRSAVQSADFSNPDADLAAAARSGSREHRAGSLRS